MIAVAVTAAVFSVQPFHTCSAWMAPAPIPDMANDENRLIVLLRTTDERGKTTIVAIVGSQTGCVNVEYAERQYERWTYLADAGE